jgi:PAS domain S-box-containing protein
MIMDKKNISDNSRFNRWEEIFNFIGQPVIILSPDQEIIEANPSTLIMTGLKKSEMIGKKCYEIFHLNRENPGQCPFKSVLEFKNGKIEEMIVESLGGYYLVSCSPIFDKKGDVEFIIHIATDITERKKTEDLLTSSVNEKEFLLKEIHHRVKNNFQVISSLLSLQADSIKDPKLMDLFNNAIHRIRSMALIHEHLYQSNKFDFVDFKSYLNTLITELYENYKINCEIEMDMKFDNIFLDNDDAVHCGLIINEILTNSFKYAFPQGFEKKPLVKIYFENAADNFLVLKISDNGVGLPRDFDIEKSSTLGINLITGLVSQINGTMILNKENGTEYVITFRKKM